MDSTKQSTDVLVVGAGMAGLIAARELLRAGRSFLVLDKGRGVGGRLASRRIDGATFDHGSQGFTTGDPRCAAVGLTERLGNAIAAWPPVSSNPIPQTAQWRGVPSMSGVAKHLATGLDVRLETTLTTLRSSGAHWMASLLSGESITAQAVVLTPPAPQSLAILDAGNVSLPLVLRHRIEAIQYDRCLAVMAVLEAPSRVSAGGSVILDSGPIASITDNQLKEISTVPAITIHATAAFSLEQWDADRTGTAHHLLKAAAPWIGTGVRSFQIHGWRYSRPRVVEPEPCVLATTNPPLILAGDGFGASGIEGAALSGFLAAKAILELLPDGARMG